MKCLAMYKSRQLEPLSTADIIKDIHYIIITSNALSA